MKHKQRERVVLVTGGAGFIGSNFCHYWLERYPQDRLINLDVLTYAGNLASVRDLETNPRYRFVQGDIKDAALVEKIMAEVDLVVHFAAESHVDRSIQAPDTFLETNIIGTHVLLKAARRHQVTRFHHISTDEVFGTLELGSAEQFQETTAYAPRSPYAASKAASDHLVRAYGETYGLPYSITNCSNNYGSYQFPEKLVPLAITNLLEGKKVPLYGAGDQVRDWLLVSDHCRAIDLVIHEGALGATYLVGGLAREYTNLEIVRLILQLMGKSEAELEFVADRPGHDVRYSVNWQKIKAELGWQPSVSVEEGLQATIEWYQTHQDWWRPLKAREAQYFSDQYSKGEKAR